ncbi:Pep3_Vps18 domain-containing protein [Meloidogyne graminicola]|uniref:Pep3_Vps18 domain-containing protein n=1 Tax=Meloidogyne graminicola TaxID=189291 RepID=A0A8S9ZUW9_9BILA|nr:Pep3_Vps18 domain-containing protein [Meloidogyne graminicola]
MRDTSRDIFVRQQVDLKLNAISHFQVQNGTMLVALNGQNLFHIRLLNSKKTDLKLHIEMHDRISHLHLDFTGVHGLVTTVSGENFYVNMKTCILKPIRRMKGMIVSAVAWNSEFNKDSETGFILIGTTKGAIYETNISSAGSINYLKQLNPNFSEKGLSISGLHFHQLSGSDCDYLLLICVPNRLYCIFGSANLQATSQQRNSTPQVVGTVWSSVMVEQNQEALNTTEKLIYSVLADKKPQYLSMKKDKENEGPPIAFAVFPLQFEEEMTPKFAWLAADGISVGTIDANNSENNGEKFDWCERLCIEININHRRSEGRLDYPLDICLTEFHLLLLYTSRIVAISLFDRTLAFEDFFIVDLQGIPKIIGMGRDASSHMIWVFTESSIFNYRPNDEGREVWRFFMERREFAKAKKVANQLQDRRPFQIILKKEAEKFMNERNFVAAAEALAHSDEPFEKLVLLLLKDGPSSRNGLKHFLELRLSRFQGNEQRMHRDMLVLWLLDIQLSEIAEHRQSLTTSLSDVFNEGIIGGITMLPSSDSSDLREAQLRRLKDQLFCFLNRPIVFQSVSDNQTAVYKMISSHVDFDLFKILLIQKSYKEILELLERTDRPNLFYEYSEELITQVPNELISLLIKKLKNKSIDPLKLLPAFLKCLNPELKNRAKMVKDFAFLSVDAIFNFIENLSPSQTTGPFVDFCINLFATFKPLELLQFMQNYINNLNNCPSFNIAEALRICTEHGLIECRVFLLCIEGLYEDAVTLALSISIELAKKCAFELEKAIELKTGESDIFPEIKNESFNMIKSGAPISQCLSLLEESKRVIRIQDILGHFPEFTKIEHFKEPLMGFLKEYSTEIKKLQMEIRDASEMAEELNEEIDKGKSSFIVIHSNSSCSSCRESIVKRQFIAFICRHCFHKDCLVDKLKLKSPEFISLIEEEKLLEKEVKNAKDVTNLSIFRNRGERNGKEEIAARKLDTIRSRIQELLLGDCPLCGVQTIENIDKPFFDSANDYLEQLKMWMP